MPFRFKQFAIQQEQTTQKVGTDSLLLACLAPTDGIKTVLDIGTGSGLIALVYAQRNVSCHITAIEPNVGAASEATLNIKQSPWDHRIDVQPISLQSLSSNHHFDLIISNPPYYSQNEYTKSAQVSKHTARYQIDLSFDELIDCSLPFMHEKSMLYVTLPLKEANQFIEKVRTRSLILNHRIDVQPHTGKPINRSILGFSLSCKDLKSSLFIIREKLEGQFVHTQQYKELLSEFLLFL